MPGVWAKPTQADLDQPLYNCCNNRLPAVPQPDSGLDASSVHQELDRVLARPAFAGSARMSRLLRFLVEETLAGRAHALKEYTIGLEVFEKPSSFDPRVDSTVRSEASKLRSKLRLYFRTEGMDDPVVITLPAGGYAMAWERRAIERVEAPPNRSRLLMVATAVVTIAAAASWKALEPRTPRTPTVLRLTSDTGYTSYPALSRDGNLVAYASDRSGRGDLDIYVQPVSGSVATRLTFDEADEYEPVFSPDGSQIAYRSDQAGGGIYLIPALGGKPRRVAGPGATPRFSPGGNQLCYSVSTWRFLPWVPGSGAVFAVSTQGGQPVPIQPGFASAHYPIFTPDGRHVVFVGRDSGQKGIQDSYDWWASPVDGGAAIRTGVVQKLSQLDLSSTDQRIPIRPESFSGGEVLFSASQSDSVGLWRIPLSPRTWKATGNPQRLTLGAGPEVRPSASASGRIAFTNSVPNSEIWALSIEANKGRPVGEPWRVTHNAAVDQWPSVSGDGTRVLFSSLRTHRVSSRRTSSLWWKDMRSGVETMVPAPGALPHSEIAHDGKSLTYHVTENGKRVAYDLDLDGRRAVKLCSGCSYLGRTQEGYLLVNSGPEPASINLWNPANGQERVFLKHPQFSLHQANLSPDGRWLAFSARSAPEKSGIAIVPFPGKVDPGQRGAPAPLLQSKHWTYITNGSAHDTTPVWSPDGRMLYFASDRDGFQCIWGQRLEPRDMRTAGAPFGVLHLHAAARRLGNAGVVFRGLSVAVDKIVFQVEERSGNIWMMTNDGDEAR